MTSFEGARDAVEAALLAVEGQGLLPGGISRPFRLRGQLMPHAPSTMEAAAWRYDGNTTAEGLARAAPATGHVFRVALFSASVAGADRLLAATTASLRQQGFRTILHEGEDVQGEQRVQRLTAISV